MTYKELLANKSDMLDEIDDCFRQLQILFEAFNRFGGSKHLKMLFTDNLGNLQDLFNEVCDHV